MGHVGLDATILSGERGKLMNFYVTKSMMLSEAGRFFFFLSFLQLPSSKESLLYLSLPRL